MLIKNLDKCVLKKAIKGRTSTGNLVVNRYEVVKEFRIQEQILQDEVTSTIYGSDVNKMLRIASPLHALERYLMPKVDNIEDNVSDYYIFYKGIQYKIIAVRSYFIDISRL